MSRSGASRRADAPRVALLTYSTRPRGGVVHSLNLAEALLALGERVHLFALGDPEAGFFRRTSAPHTIVPAPSPAGTLEERVVDSMSALFQYLRTALPGSFDLVHAQDCIAARAATNLRDAGSWIPVIRTVHHVDDFTTRVLVDCQRRSIVTPDRVLVVSEHWRRLLRADYGVEATVVTNGVDAERFERPVGFDGSALRERVGADGRFLFLTVGGIEPRKGSIELVEALGKVRASIDPPPVLAVVGGHSFQDYAEYRDRFFERAAALGVEVGRDVVLLGTVPDDELPGWYQAADAFVFPSVKEGWGLVALEALAAGLPVITSDIPVFREYLTDGEGVLMVPAGDASALSDGMRRVAVDADLRASLAAEGPAVAGRYTWEACASRHAEIYREVAAPVSEPPEPR
ncbi:MAG: MSMEG_0565 family glycosyltransferase [Actinomycetota bacterium]